MLLQDPHCWFARLVCQAAPAAAGLFAGAKLLRVLWQVRKMVSGALQFADNVGLIKRLDDPEMLKCWLDCAAAQTSLLGC